MTDMRTRAPWKALGWKEVPRKSGTAPIQWLRGVVHHRKRFGCPLHHQRYGVGHVIDHAITMRNAGGDKVVVSHPYLGAPPEKLAQACLELFLEFEWLPPSESWYGHGTSRVVFRLSKRAIALAKLGANLGAGFMTEAELDALAARR